MDPKVEALVLALNDFARAGLALEQAWQEADDLTGDALDGYPLQNAFEEATHDIVTWCRDAAATPLGAGGVLTDTGRVPMGPAIRVTTVTGAAQGGCRRRR